MATSSATKAVRAIRRALPEGRVSQEPGTSLFNFWGLADAGSVPGFEEDRRTLIGHIREYCNKDEDVGGSLRDFVALVNPGWSLSYEGGQRAKAQADEAVKELCARMFAYAGNLDGLISHQAAEFYQTGTSSCEWYPGLDKRSVADVAVVAAEHVSARRVSGQLEFYQKRQGQFVSGPVAPYTPGFERAERPGTPARRRDRVPRLPSAQYGTALHPLTYCYTAFMPQGESLYGTPIIISALNALARKGRIDSGTERVIKLMGKGALVSVTIPKPTPEELCVESAADPAYEQALEDYMNEVADLVVQGQDEQLYFAYETDAGKPDITVHAYAGSANGLRELELGNLLRVWSGVASTPFLRGYVESTTEALAKTMWLILKAHAENIQPLIKHQVEFGLNLHLRLQGIAATVAITFKEPPNPYDAQDATADKTRAETDEKLLQMFGLDYMPIAAKRWGVVLGETRKELPRDMRTDLEPQTEDARTQGVAKAREALKNL